MVTEKIPGLAQGLVLQHVNSISQEITYGEGGSWGAARRESSSPCLIQFFRSPQWLWQKSACNDRGKLAPRPPAGPAFPADSPTDTATSNKAQGGWP